MCILLFLTLLVQFPVNEKLCYDLQSQNQCGVVLTPPPHLQKCHTKIPL